MPQEIYHNPDGDAEYIPIMETPGVAFIIAERRWARPERNSWISLADIRASIDYHSKYSFHNELSSLPDPVSEPTGVFHENWCTLTSSMLRSSYFHLSTSLTRRQMITYIFPLLLSSLFRCCVIAEHPSLVSPTFLSTHLLTWNAFIHDIDRQIQQLRTEIETSCRLVEEWHKISKFKIVWNIIVVYHDIATVLNDLHLVVALNTVYIFLCVLCRDIHKEVLLAILSCWPAVVIACFMTYLAGIVVWALVSYSYESNKK